MFYTVSNITTVCKYLEEVQVHTEIISAYLRCNNSHLSLCLLMQLLLCIRIAAWNSRSLQVLCLEWIKTLKTKIGFTDFCRISEIFIFVSPEHFLTHKERSI